MFTPLEEKDLAFFNTKVFKHKRIHLNEELNI